MRAHRIILHLFGALTSEWVWRHAAIHRKRRRVSIQDRRFMANAKACRFWFSPDDPLGRRDCVLASEHIKG